MDSESERTISQTPTPKFDLGAEYVVTDPITGGQKAQKLTQYSLIPPHALAELAKVYGRGAQKYARRNWEKGYAWSLSYDAMLRHLELFRVKESIDEDGLHHLAHAMFHLIALYEFERRSIGLDDLRTAPGPEYKITVLPLIPHRSLESIANPRTGNTNG